jgi:hypothetical protein
MRAIGMLYQYGKYKDSVVLSNHQYSIQSGIKFAKANYKKVLK